jgi:hypothetical protein
MKNKYHLLACIACFFIAGLAADVMAQATIRPSRPEDRIGQQLAPAPERVLPEVKSETENTNEGAREASSAPASSVASNESFEVTLFVNSLDVKEFKSYKKIAAKTEGVSVIGFCDNEKIVMLVVNRSMFLSNRVAAEPKFAELKADELSLLLANELTAKTNKYSEVSIKHLSEVKANCSTFVN